MWRIAFAVFLALHGFAHQVGFLAAWQLGEFRDRPLDTRVLAGQVDVGVAGTRALGLAWLVTGLAFMAAGAAVWRSMDGWLPIAAGIAALSLVLSVLAWPDSWIGVVLNLLVLAGLVYARGYGIA